MTRRAVSNQKLFVDCPSQPPLDASGRCFCLLDCSGCCIGFWAAGGLGLQFVFGFQFAHFACLLLYGLVVLLNVVFVFGCCFVLGFCFQKKKYWTRLFAVAELVWWCVASVKT